MATKGTRRREPLSDKALVERVQSVLINAATGRRSLSDDRDYTNLRKQLSRRPFRTPQLVATHPTVDSFVAFINGVADRAERERMVRDEFEPRLRSLEEAETEATDSAAWTGNEGRAARLKLVRGLLPVARSAVESLIDQLSAPNPNNAPMLDEREEALTHLRELHRTLGELLAAVDAGHLDDELGEGLQAEAARYAKRAARALRSDPMPYISSALLLSVFSACGFPGIGGYLADIALNVQKYGTRRQRD